LLLSSVRGTDKNFTVNPSHPSWSNLPCKFKFLLFMVITLILNVI